MKKIISVLLLLVMIMPMIPIFTFSETLTETVFFEDFESGEYTLEEQENLKVLKNDGVEQWFFADSDGVFNEAFPKTAEEVVTAPYNDAASGNYPNNESKAALNLSGFTIGTSTVIYHNLDKKYNTGKLNVSVKLRRPGYASGSSQLAVNLFENMCESYETSSPAVSTQPLNNKVASINFENHGGTPKVGQNWYDEYGRFTSSIKMGSTYKNNLKGWPRFDIEVDFDAKKVRYSVYSGSNYSKQLANTVYEMDFLNPEAEGVSAIAFSAGYNESEKLSDNINSIVIDDVIVKHTYTKVAEAEVTLEGRAVIGETLKGTYLSYFHEAGYDEAQSVCTWYRADNYDFTTAFEPVKTENISVGESSEYTLTEEDKDKFIVFAVTPKANEPSGIVNGEQAYMFAEGGAVRPYYDKPYVTLETPSVGDYIYTADVLNLSASSICDSSEVKKIEYYANDTLIAESNQAPFNAEATLDVGKYQIAARAYNANGDYGDSLPHDIVITSMNSVKFYQQDGVSPLSNTVTAYDGIVAKVEVSNTSDDTMFPTLVVGAYEENKLIGVACSTPSVVEAGVTQEIFLEMPISNYQRINMDKFRAFVWNSDTYENYCEPTRFNRHDIRVLTIGNSFANNAATYIRSIAAADGENIILGKANISSSAFDTHTNIYKKGTKSYSLTVTGKVFVDKCTLQECLEAEYWDFITIQQVSFKSHLYDTYLPQMVTLAGILKTHAPQAKVILHETWAYAEKCSRLINTSDSYYKKYFNGITQEEMFAGIESANKQGAELLGCRIFPSGYAFQLLRRQIPDSLTEAVGGTLNNSGDGYHCNDKGKYLAGAVYYECMTGKSMLDNTYKLSGISEETMRQMRQAAHEAAVEYGWID